MIERLAAGGDEWVLGWFDEGLGRDCACGEVYVGDSQEEDSSILAPSVRVCLYRWVVPAIAGLVWRMVGARILYSIAGS